MESEKKAWQEKLKLIKKNHPDCIPVFFYKHPECTTQMKQPQNPMVLFKKNLKIQQAMITLYKQIQFKGLYFFCPYLTMPKKNKKLQDKQVQEQVKFYMLKPGPTIQDIFKRFGNAGYLTLVYGDKDLGLGGMVRFQKWMIRGLIFLAIIWVTLFLISYIKPYTVQTPTQQTIPSGQQIYDTYDI